jgi:hypothetical protein
MSDSEKASTNIMAYAHRTTLYFRFSTIAVTPFS